MIQSPLLALIFLFCANLVTGMISAISRMGKFQVELTCAENNRHFLLKYPSQLIFVKKNREILSFALPTLKYLLLLAYASLAFSFIYFLKPERPTIFTTLIELCIIFLVYVVTDLLFQGLSLFRPKTFFKIASSIISPLLLLFWPILFSSNRTKFLKQGINMIFFK